MSDTSATRKEAPWSRAIVAAILLLYLPALVPYVLGYAEGVEERYWRAFAGIPGALAGAFLPHAPDLTRLLVSGLASGAIFLLVAQLWRVLPRKGRVILAVLCLVGFTIHAFGFVNALRA